MKCASAKTEMEQVTEAALRPAEKDSSVSVNPGQGAEHTGRGNVA